MIEPKIASHDDLIDVFYMASAFCDAIEMLVGEAETSPKQGGAIRFLAMALGDVSRWMLQRAEFGELALQAKDAASKAEA